MSTIERPGPNRRSFPPPLPPAGVQTISDPSESLDIRSWLLGFSIGAFALSPGIGGFTGLPNVGIYVSASAVAVLLAISGLLTGFKATSRLSWGFVCLFFFFVMMSVRVPTFDEFGWQAFLSVGLCITLVLSALMGRRKPVGQGLLVAVVLVGLATTWTINFNSNYAFARTYGWNREEEAYLVTGPLVGAALGPVVLYFMSSRKWVIKALLFCVAFLLIYSLGNVLGRGALLSGLACLFLALTYSGASRAGAKITALVRGLALFLPFIPIGLALLASNRYLSARLERMMDPAAELASGGRGDIWAATINLIEANPIMGGGVASSQARIGIYPHNAILEAWADLGIFGALAISSFALFFALSFWKALVRGQSAISFALHLIAFVFVMEAMKSGSVYLSRPMFIFGLLAIMFERHRSPPH